MIPARKFPLVRVNTTDAVVAELTRMILDGTAPPGTRLSEVEVSAHFSVSRQSTRSAFLELTFLGLLTRERNRGVRVADLTRSDLRDLYFVREIVETAAAAHLAQHPELIPSESDVMRGFHALAEDVPWSDVIEADILFHSTLITSVGSHRLTRTHDLLAIETRLAGVRAQDFIDPAQMVVEHQMLFDAICSGDPQAAAARYRQHIAWGTDDVLSALPD